jgi:hypothetical protein|nr:PepSY-associated TM helix domain-containing protein [uncultured Emticicia sp.]
MKIESRSLHRDLGYLYVGLIISFSISGILQNHRDAWKPEKYSSETKQVSVQLPQDEKELTEDFAKNLGEKLGIKDKFRRSTVKKGELKISYEKNEVEIDIKSGKGEIVTYSNTPLISQMHLLHKSTSNWWIYYSDVFGIALLTIAITGMMMIKKGKFSFKERGWKLAAAGIIFPLVFLLFMS